MKNIDFTLINLPPWSQENPHIGIGYLCSYLRSREIRCSVMDLNKSFFLKHPDFQMLWHVENKNFWSGENTFPILLKVFEQDIEQAIMDMASISGNVLGFSVVDPKERITIEFIKRIKRKYPKKRIVLGGPATSTPEQRDIFLKHAGALIDAFVLGEGERALFRLVCNFKNQKDITGIESCMVSRNEQWHFAKQKKSIDIKSISFPTYEEFDLGLYGKSILVEWSRGCLGKCSFCKNRNLSSIYRPKPVNSIIEELIYHTQKNNIKNFTVSDNILNGDLDMLRQVCEQIINQDIRIEWSGQIAPARGMDSVFFSLMRRAGCTKLQIGFESGSNKVLRAMKKTFTSEISESNIRFANRAGIETEIFVMIGFPGEDECDFRKTYNFIKRNSDYIDTLKSINTLHLIAGTEVFERRKDFGIDSLPDKDWHYLWEACNDNVYKTRKKRVERLLDLANDLNLKVMETNIREGKENIFNVLKADKTENEKILLLKDALSDLQQFSGQDSSSRVKKRGTKKWCILLLLFAFTFFYILYFWIFMLLRKRMLLGGRK